METIVVQGQRYPVSDVHELCTVPAQLAAHMKARGFDAYGTVSLPRARAAIAYRATKTRTWHVVSPGATATEPQPPAATLAPMSNHPNRGGGRFNRAGANPTPAQIARLRSEAGLTQAAFGALVYKSVRIVEDWESGARRMPPDTWELVQIKIKAHDLVRRGRIAPQAVEDLGLTLPGK